MYSPESLEIQREAGMYCPESLEIQREARHVLP
jgi:hypothetical protein